MKKKLALMFLSLLVTLCAAEFAARLLMKPEIENTWLKKERFIDKVRPNPWLGATRRPDTWMKNTDISKFPRVKKDGYTILLTGGSVAQLLGESGQLEPRLKKIFNKDITILNIAEGGAEQPRSTIALLLYCDIVDGVICLDGFNEAYKFRSPYLPMDKPPVWFYDMNPLTSNNYDSIGSSWLSNELKGFAERQPFALVSLATSVARKQLQKTYSSESFEDKQYPGLPHEWSDEEKYQYNLGQYKKYIALSKVICKSRGIWYEHFIQPCPALHKHLTEEELKVVGDLGYGKSYEKLAGDLPEAISLLDILEDYSGTLYADQIHFGFKTQGNSILAERVACRIKVSE